MYTKKIIMPLIHLIVLALFFVFSGCASLQASYYVLTADFNGDTVLEKEQKVRVELEQVIKNAKLYIIKAYSRSAISYNVKKTKDTTHSFYVFLNENGEFKTLSFCATRKLPSSEGAWALNTETDIESYENYIRKNNFWHVEEIKTQKGINTQETAKKILEKTNSNTTYYYRSTPNENDDTDNCNTALLETLVENQFTEDFVTTTNPN